MSSPFKRIASIDPIFRKDLRNLQAQVRKASLIDFISEDGNERLSDIVHKEILPNFRNKVFNLFRAEAHRLSSEGGKVTGVSDSISKSGVAETGPMPYTSEVRWTLEYPSLVEGFCTVGIDISKAFKDVEFELKQAGISDYRLSEDDMEYVIGTTYDLEEDIRNTKVNLDVSDLSAEAVEKVTAKSSFYCERDAYDIDHVSFDLYVQKATLLEINLSAWHNTLTLKYALEIGVDAEFTE